MCTCPGFVFGIPFENVVGSVVVALVGLVVHVAIVVIVAVVG